ncbi:MAG TPA: hypothetical protein VF143_07445 [Candidatus Nanopelagicales bacterium]
METLTILRDYVAGALLVLAAWTVVLAAAVVAHQVLRALGQRPGLPAGQGPAVHRSGLREPS